MIDFPVQRPKGKGGGPDGLEGRVGRVDHEPARGKGQGLERGWVEAGFGSEAARVEGEEVVMVVALGGDAEGGGCKGNCVGKDWEDEEGD